MEPKDYILIRMEGEYAFLQNTETQNEVCVALALLPSGADIGSKIYSECMEYTLIE